VFRFGRTKKKERKKRKKTNRTINIKERLAYDPLNAFRLVKAHSVSPFDESVDMFIKLGTNASRTEFNIRGSCYMPNAIGNKLRICFLPANEKEEQIAREAGINLICTENMLERISNGIIDFDKLYASEEGVKKLKPFARILGPKGLFPNKKVNRILMDNFL
jgi:large subunit ribosomal protein L1